MLHTPPSECFGWRISLSSSHHVVDRSDQWMVFVPALQPQQGLWITYRRRSVRSAQDTEGWRQCRGHLDQIKGRESRSESAIHHLCLAGETARRKMRGRGDKEPPAASAKGCARQATSGWLLTPPQVHKHSAECRGPLSKLPHHFEGGSEVQMWRQHESTLDRSKRLRLEIHHRSSWWSGSSDDSFLWRTVLW